MDKNKSNRIVPKGKLKKKVHVDLLGANDNELVHGIPIAFKDHQDSPDSDGPEPQTEIEDNERKEHHNIEKRKSLGARRTSRLNLEKSSHTNIDIDQQPRIDFHENEVHQALYPLNKMGKVYIKKNSTDPNRFDIFDDTGSIIYRLLNFTKALDLTEINFCLMTGDGKKQLLILSGDSGFLGLNGELIARYPGSLPGDQELIFGSVKQKTLMCSFKPKYTVKDQNEKEIFKIVDKNPSNILDPFRKCIPCHFDLVKENEDPDQVVYGVIEEQSMPGKTNPHQETYVHTTHPMPGNSRKSFTMTTNPTSTATASPLIESIFGAHRNVQNHPKPEKRRKGMIKNAHADFCIGFNPELDFRIRALLITGHILLNFDHLGQKKCTRFLFSCILITIAVVFLLGVVFGLIYFLFKD